MGEAQRSAELKWMAVGALLVAAVVALAWSLQRPGDAARMLASKANRVELVSGMQVELARAAEAEKSAVLAVTDEASQGFAEEARRATARLEATRLELAGVLSTSGAPSERELLAEFGRAFEDFRQVDAEVLELAVRNTNLKAWALLFGPVAEAEAELDRASSSIAARASRAGSAATVAHALGVALAVHRSTALLAPHIAERDDARMDALEVRMARERAAAGRELEALRATRNEADRGDVAAARAAFDRLEVLRTQVLALSRQNTNVRSLELSLDRKRKVTLACLERLEALRGAFLDEPTPGVAWGRPRPTR